MLELKIVVLGLLVAVARTAVIQDDVPADRNELGQPDSLKQALKAIADRLDRWDMFYMGRLEPRMIGAATSLANLDTNIRNLQERAHIWDTFQLHVSAWNEQIKSLDHKVNIIHEGYEKLLSLDTQLNSALHPNGTLAAVLTRLTTLDARVEALAHGAVRTESPIPVFGDFAARGLLHTVRTLERKIDRMQTSLDRKPRPTEAESLLKDPRGSSEELAAGSQCSTHALEELLRDVSSKVDSIFDKNEDEVEMRHNGRGCQRGAAQYRRLAGSVEYVRNVVQDLVQDAPEIETGAALRRPRRLPVLEAIKDSVEDLERSIAQLSRQQDRNINENERILRRIDRKVDAIAKDDDIEELLEKKLTRIEKQLRGLKRDDSDESKDKDTDEDDSDDNDTKEKKRRRKGEDSDDDDDSDDGSDDKKSKRRGKGKDSDDDDSDDDDTREKKSRKRGKDDEDSDDDDSDDNDTNEKKSRRKGKDSDDDSDDDDDTREKKSRKRGKDDDSDDDSDENDTKEKKSKRRGKHDDDSDDDNDTKEKKSRRKGKDSNDDDDSDETKEKKSRKGSRNDSDDDESKEKSKGQQDDSDEDDSDETAERKTKRSPCNDNGDDCGPWDVNGASNGRRTWKAGQVTQDPMGRMPSSDDDRQVIQPPPVVPTEPILQIAVE